MPAAAVPGARPAAPYVSDHAPSSSEQTVIDCYEFFDRIFPECGLLDFTDGMYKGDPAVSYERAQENQISWMLDQISCRSGSRVLDMGCGNGTLVAACKRRGATAVGITVSPSQARRCVKDGLDVRVMDYREINDRWRGHFDGVVANGSIEHFVQPIDAAEGRADAIYRHLFQTCHRILNPQSSSGKLATTVIHFHGYRPEPRNLLRRPLSFRPLSDDFHAALLEKCMGGYYPYGDQLERCAQPYFRLVDEVDGTEDYRRTSEQWLERTRRCFVDWKTAPRIAANLIPYAIRHPAFSLTALSLLFTASWQWQFRGDVPKTKLLRQVWQRQPFH